MFELLVIESLSIVKRGFTVSNICLKELFTVGNVYTLTCLPSRTNGIYKKIPDIKLHDEFKFIGNEIGCRNNFQHIKTGVMFALNLVLFLNSPRFMHASYDQSTPKTALFVCSDIVLYPYGSTSKELRSHARTGTMFLSFQSEEKFYIVTDNTGKKYRAYKSSCMPVVDVNHKVSKTVVTSQVKVKPESIVIKEEKKLVSCASFEVVSQTSFAINGVSFENAQDAKFASETLATIASVANYQFKSSVDQLNFEVMLKGLLSNSQSL